MPSPKTPSLPMATLLVPVCAVAFGCGRKSGTHTEIEPGKVTAERHDGAAAPSNARSIGDRLASGHGPVVFVATGAGIEAKTVQGKPLQRVVDGVFGPNTAGACDPQAGLLWYVANSVLTAVDLRKPSPEPIPVVTNVPDGVPVEVNRTPWGFIARLRPQAPGNEGMPGVSVVWGEDVGLSAPDDYLATLRLVGRDWLAKQANRPRAKDQIVWDAEAPALDLRAVERDEGKRGAGPGLSRLVCEDSDFDERHCRDCCEGEKEKCCGGDLDPVASKCIMPECVYPASFGASGWVLFMARSDGRDDTENNKTFYGCLLYDPASRSVAVPGSSPTWVPATKFDSDNVPKEPWGSYGSCGPYFFDSTGTVYYTPGSQEVCAVGSGCTNMGGPVLGFLRPGHTIFYGPEWP